MLISPWDQGTRLYEAALDVRNAVHETIGANLANEETPGYQARHLPFQETLEAVLRGEFPVQPVHSHPRHLPPTTTVADRIFEHSVIVKSGGGPDGNTVNLEKEMTRMAENTLFYMAVSQFLSGRFDGWRAAIEEGRR